MMTVPPFGCQGLTQRGAPPLAPVGRSPPGAPTPRSLRSAARATRAEIRFASRTLCLTCVCLSPALESRVELLEVGEPGRDAKRLGDAVEHRLERLVAVAGDGHDDRFVARDAALLDQLLGHRHGGAAGRLREDALGPREETDALDDLLVGDRLTPAARVAPRPPSVVPVCRIADRDRLGDG